MPKQLLPEPEFEICDDSRFGPKQFWLRVRLNRQWVAAHRIFVQHGRPVVGELRVFPLEPDDYGPGRWSAEKLGINASVPRGGLHARLVHNEVRLGEHLRISRKIAAKLGLASAQEPKVRSSPAKNGRRRRGRPDRFYLTLAARYARLVEQSNRNPRALLAERYGVSRERMSDMIHQSRVRGFLAKGTPGRAGGQVLTRESSKKERKRGSSR